MRHNVDTPENASGSDGADWLSGLDAVTVLDTTLDADDDYSLPDALHADSELFKAEYSGKRITELSAEQYTVYVHRKSSLAQQCYQFYQQHQQSAYRRAAVASFYRAVELGNAMAIADFSFFPHGAFADVGTIDINVADKIEVLSAGSLFFLGVDYLLSAQGRTPFCKELVEELWRQAAKKGDARAQYHFGALSGNTRDFLSGSKKINLKKISIKKTRRKKRGLKKLLPWAKAPNKKVVRIQYSDGHSLVNSFKKAFSWIQMSAEQGCSQAQRDLGVMYERGYGVAHNHQQACYWYQQAAEQGHVGAQFNFGFMFEIGHGVRKDDEQAFYWYQKSAEQGYDKAQYRIGIMHQAGQGIDRNEEKACYWLQKSALQGNNNAVNHLRKWSERNKVAQYIIAQVYSEPVNAAKLTITEEAVFNYFLTTDANFDQWSEESGAYLSQVVESLLASHDQSLTLRHRIQLLERMHALINACESSEMCIRLLSVLQALLNEKIDIKAVIDCPRALLISHLNNLPEYLALEVNSVPEEDGTYVISYPEILNLDVLVNHFEKICYYLSEANGDMPLNSFISDSSAIVLFDILLQFHDVELEVNSAGVEFSEIPLLSINQINEIIFSLKSSASIKSPLPSARESEPRASLMAAAGFFAGGRNSADADLVSNQWRPVAEKF